MGAASHASEIENPALPSSCITSPYSARRQARCSSSVLPFDAMRGPPGTSLYSGHPLATIRITQPIKNAAPDVQFLAQYANALAFHYTFHNRLPKLRRKTRVAAIRTSRSLQFVPIFRISQSGCTSLRPGFSCNDRVVKSREEIEKKQSRFRDLTTARQPMTCVKSELNLFGALCKNPISLIATRNVDCWSRRT